MSTWECGIDGCGERFDTPEGIILHQTNDHEQCECRVCGTIVPDGYFAIRHAFENHTRAEYVRAYGASATEVRRREQIKAKIENGADLQSVVDGLNQATG